MARTGPEPDHGVEIHPLDPHDVQRAQQMLQLAERVLGVPLVDEGEQVRLARAADGEAIAGWWPVLALRDGVAAGYGAVVATGTWDATEANTSTDGAGADTTEADATRSDAGRSDTGTDGAGAGGVVATGDAAIAAAALDRQAVLTALLEALAEHAQDAEADELTVWVRHVDEADLSAAQGAGFRPRRRLAILGRELAGLPATPPPPAGLRIRPSRAHEDDGHLASVLAAAYAGTDDGGWDLARVRERTSLPWFRAEDVLLAEDDDGTVLGLHWLKRRSDTEGEVYNLAVHPDGQGRGLGSALLHAGLAHLAEVGCEQVILWVDRANEPAVELYTSQGFTTRWEDVALARSFTSSLQP